MKFTYIKKSNGSNTHPCGTPDVTGMERVEVPDTDTDLVQPIRKLSIHEITIGSKPSNCSLFKTRRCDTISKAFEKIEVRHIHNFSFVHSFSYFRENKEQLIFCTSTLTKFKLLIRQYLNLFKIVHYKRRQHALHSLTTNIS